MHCLLLTLTLCAALHDRPVLALMAAQSVAMTADGISTRRFVARGREEGEPLARFVLGSRPTWKRMAPIGAGLVVGQAWLAERLKRSHNDLLRRIWWLPQVVTIDVSTTLAWSN